MFLQDQYKFLYRVLYESFRLKNHILTKENFVQEVESLMSSNEAVNFSSLRTQFEVRLCDSYIRKKHNRILVIPICHAMIDRL